MPDYIIKTSVPTNDPQIQTERLVRAKNEARAVAHIVKDSIICAKAQTDDVIRLTAAGVKLEQAE